MSVFLFALSGKKILLVRRKLKAAKSEFGLHRELCEEPPTRHRGFSSFGTACMSPTVSAGSGRLPLVSNITPDPFSPKFKGLEPLTPTHSREVPYSLELSPFATNASPPLDRYTSNQGLLRKRAARFDSIYWKYAKFAFLCTLVLLITWVCCLEASSCGTLTPSLLSNLLLITHSYLLVSIEYTITTSVQITNDTASTLFQRCPSHYTALATSSYIPRPAGKNAGTS
jgi:hypothetical protein